MNKKKKIMPKDRITPSKNTDTVGSIEKDYGVDFDTNPNKKLTTYLREKGMPSLAKALDVVEKLREES